MFSWYTTVGWKVHRLNMMQWSHFTERGLFFQHSLPCHACGPHTSYIGVVALGLPWYRISHPDPWKSPQLQQIWPHQRSRETASQPSDFSRWGQKKVRWCQIRRMWSLINQIKATVTHNSHCNHIFVCRSIVLVKQNPLRQFSRPF